MEVEKGVTRRIIDELHASIIQEDEIDGEICFTRSIIDVIHSSDIQQDQIGG